MFDVSQLHNALTFSVLDVPDEDRTWFGKWVGAVRPDLQWTTERLADEVTHGLLTVPQEQNQCML